MGRMLALILGGFGLGAYVRRRRTRPALPAYSPADELRAKLAESRTPELEPEPEREQTTAVEPEPDLDVRRREVHDRARGAIDDLS